MTWPATIPPNRRRWIDCDLSGLGKGREQTAPTIWPPAALDQAPGRYGKQRCRPCRANRECAGKVATISSFFLLPSSFFLLLSSFFPHPVRQR
jgi:hypothetical protein